MCEEEVPIINNGKSDENIIAIIYLILKLVLYNLLTPFASTDRSTLILLEMC